MILSKGNPKGKIVIVGDALSQYDWERGEAIALPTWELINWVAEQSGLPLNEIYFVPCYLDGPKPSSGKLSVEALSASGKDVLARIIGSCERKVVIVQGNNALCAAGISDKAAGVKSYRGRVVRGSYFGDTPVICSTSPYLLQKSPDENETEILSDFALAKRCYVNDFEEQMPAEHVRLETLGTFEDFINDYSKVRIYYDTETSGLDNNEKDKIVTYGFYKGEENALGQKIGYTWAGFDKMRPRYEEHTMNQFREGFVYFFNSQEEGVREFGLWNSTFDHLMLESDLKVELPFPYHDAMLKKWVINKYCDYKLKNNVVRDLGYADYEAKLMDIVNEIVSRRKKVMRLEDPSNADDFRCLEYYGKEPILGKHTKKLGQGYHWNKDVPYKAWAWALVDLDTLLWYQMYDAIYTGELDIKYSKVIEASDSLQMSSDLRHYINKTLARATQRGLLTDVQVNKELSILLGNLLADAEMAMRKSIHELAPEIDYENFNPNSGKQLIKLLYGEPVKVPIIDRENLENVGYNRSAIKRVCTAVEEAVYGDGDDLVQAIRDGDYDYEVAKSYIQDEWKKRKNKIDAPITDKNVYAKGVYLPNPEMLTKTGLPATGKAALNYLYAQKPVDFLQYLLLRGKAGKIKSTFVDSILKKLDGNNVLHGQYKATGTKTGRISSCVDADTLIITNRGNIRIVDLNIGEDKVLTHRGQWKTVIDLIDKGLQPMVEIELESGQKVLCTPAHRVLTKRGWVAVAQLVEDDEIVVNYVYNE